MVFYCFLLLGWIYTRILIPNLRQLFKILKKVSKNLRNCPWLKKKKKKTFRNLLPNLSKMPWKTHSVPECHQVTIHQSVQTLLHTGTRCRYTSKFNVLLEVSPCFFLGNTHLSKSWHYGHFGLDKSLLWGLFYALTAGCLIAPLASTHWMPVVVPQLGQPKINVSRHH